MEVEEMQSPGCKFQRIRNITGRIQIHDESAKNKNDDQYNNHHNEEDEADGEEEEVKRANIHRGTAAAVGVGGGGGLDITAPSGLGRLCGWPSSRIVRVSRASGGKDRHSKVWTSKGLRDRRVRLSVNTAIQFYDLQDRLGYDQPSKAVEWLLKAAASSIKELPSINTAFPDTPQQQVSDEKRSQDQQGGGFDSAEVEMEDEQLNYQQHQQQQQQQQLQLGGFSKSAGSSTSETSKGSFSRSESRIKARERARERAAEKEKEKDHNVNNSISQTSSFTELLTAGLSNSGNNASNATSSNNNSSPNGGSIHQNPGRGGGGCNGSNNGSANEPNLSPRDWSASTPHMDYFATGLLGLSSSSRSANHQASSAGGFLGQIQLGNNNQLHHSFTPSVSSSSPLFTITADHHHPEVQHFSFVPDHSVPVVIAAAAVGNGNNSHSNHLNFTITPSSSSSGLAGFNRGTLQSNSSSTPSQLAPHFQRLFSPIVDGPPTSPFFTSSPPTNAASVAASVENNHHHNHHFLSGFDAPLQLFHAENGRRHSDQKSKGKN